MSPVAAVASCFRQYVGFTGRARRSEFWWYVLFDAILYVASLALDYAVGAGGLIGAIVFLVTLPPYVAVIVRRLHDVDRSGWWVLLVFVPCVGPIALIVWGVTDSARDNRWGPYPKASPAPLG